MASDLVSQISVVDILRSCYIVLLYAPAATFLVFLSHMQKPDVQQRSLTEHITQAVGPRIAANIPPAVIQRLLRAFILDKRSIVKSNRFLHLENQILKEVNRPDFAGSWICRGLDPKPLVASESDVFIFYMHGGGYAMGEPVATAPELLFLAEILTRKGLKTSLFSLNYTLVPGACFPTQVDQALAAYDWITGELNVKPSRILLMGESAGGHLVLSLLTALYQRDKLQSPSINRNEWLPRAGFLMSPWLDLYNSNPRTSAFPNKDLVNNAALKHWADLLLKQTSPALKDLYQNFAASNPRRGSWRDVLPPYTWISMGTREPMFSYDIEDFVEQARADGVSVDLDVEEGKPHAWQSIEAMWHHREYLSLVSEIDEIQLMGGYRKLAEKILSVVKNI